MRLPVDIPPIDQVRASIQEMTGEHSRHKVNRAMEILLAAGLLDLRAQLVALYTGHSIGYVYILFKKAAEAGIFKKCIYADSMGRKCFRFSGWGEIHCSWMDEEAGGLALMLDAMVLVDCLCRHENEKNIESEKEKDLYAALGAPAPGASPEQKSQVDQGAPRLPGEGE